MIAFMGDVIRFVLRLSPEMHQELKNWAEREDRSLHSLIVHVLRRALREWGQTPN
jgi:hypothetical protein